MEDERMRKAGEAEGAGRPEGEEAQDEARTRAEAQVRDYQDKLKKRAAEAMAIRRKAEDEARRGVY